MVSVMLGATFFLECSRISLIMDVTEVLLSEGSSGAFSMLLLLGFPKSPFLRTWCTPVLSYAFPGDTFCCPNWQGVSWVRVSLGHGFLILCLSKLSRGHFEQSVGRGNKEK